MNIQEDAPQELRALYRGLFGSEAEVVAMPQSGGDRRYYMLRSEDREPVVGTCGPDSSENRCFASLSSAFREEGIKVPEVYGMDPEGKCYIQEYLGEDTLLPLLKTSGRKDLAAQSLRSLVKMQTLDEEVWLPHVICAPYSVRMVMWDLNYFKYGFLKPAGITFDENALEDDFERLARDAAEVPEEMTGFMYRDFQSRNIIIKRGEPWFIDFQGGRKGPLLYDAVSFLWQAKAGFTREERAELLEIYASALSDARDVGMGEVLSDADKMALFRTLQVLGAYGFRGLTEQRAHFIESIPAAIRNFSELLSSGALDGYPELKRVAERCAESRFAGKSDGQTGLTVKVFSFSYKRGYPEDLTGNGGGFMFDCRGMHNPGRYEEYKNLTGLDSEVISFLEERGEVQKFVGDAIGIVTPSVERYLQRGFSSLQIGFGCTGGRHRSVYCAQHMAEQLAERYPEARIELIHREQGIRELLNGKNQ